MTRPLSTRLFELGLPLFSGLNLGLVMQAQAEIQEGNFNGLTKMMESFGTMGELHTVRKLAALWGATDVELRMAEADPAIMVQLEERAAELPFLETFKATMDFQQALFESLGVTPTSSKTEAEPKVTRARAKQSTPSVD